MSALFIDFPWLVKWVKRAELKGCTHRTTAQLKVCGTADYFAPETLKQVGHNRAADWWAHGSGGP